MLSQNSNSISLIKMDIPVSANILHFYQCISHVITGHLSFIPHEVFQYLISLSPKFREKYGVEKGLKYFNGRYRNLY